MSELEIQKIYGEFRDLDCDPETTVLRISLSVSAVLYKDETQIVGAQKEVSLNAFGEWETDLVDTDNMEGAPYYDFEINDRIYKKRVPVSASHQNFNELPNVVF